MKNHVDTLREAMPDNFEQKIEAYIRSNFGHCYPSEYSLMEAVKAEIERQRNQK